MAFGKLLVTAVVNRGGKRVQGPGNTADMYGIGLVYRYCSYIAIYGLQKETVRQRSSVGVRERFTEGV